jgi:hypothetical protein
MAGVGRLRLKGRDMLGICRIRIFFARGIEAWMEGREMPGGYVELD